MRRRRINSKPLEKENITKHEKEIRENHEGKIHVSPWYFIWDMKMVTWNLVRLMVALSLVIILLNAQFVISTTSPKYGVNSNGQSVDSKLHIVPGDRDATYRNERTRTESELSYPKFEGPILISSLGKIPHQLTFQSPNEPIEFESEDDETRDTCLHCLPDDFRQFYNQSVFLGVKHNEDVDKMKISAGDELEGHVYTEEDYLDDYLVGENDYWIESMSYDDDVNASPKIEEDGTRSLRCTKPSWYRQHHPTCNKLHEVPIFNKDEYVGRYLASGSYRDAFWIHDGDAVLKVARLVQDYR